MVKKKPTWRTVKIPRRRIRTSKVSILGLDCSSATMGWGLIVLNKEPTLVAYGHFKPLDTSHPEMVRLQDVHDKITDLCNDLQPTYVAVEDIFLFMKGKSRAQTITTLTAFNRVASLAGHNSSEGVYFYTVHDIRKIIKTLLGLENTIAKEDMPDVIIEHLEPQFEKMLNRNGDVAKETYDEADGIASAWACAFHKQNEDVVNPLLEKPKKKKRKKS